MTVPTHPGPLPTGSTFDFPERQARHNAAIATWSDHANAQIALSRYILTVCDDEHVRACGGSTAENFEAAFFGKVVDAISSQGSECARLDRTTGTDLASTGARAEIAVPRRRIDVSLADTVLTVVAARTMAALMIFMLTG